MDPAEVGCEVVDLIHMAQDSASGGLLRTYIHTYLLTPWSRGLLEKLTGFQLVKKFPTFYETLMFITTIASAHHLSLS